MEDGQAVKQKPEKFGGRIVFLAPKVSRSSVHFMESKVTPRLAKPSSSPMTGLGEDSKLLLPPHRPQSSTQRQYLALVAKDRHEHLVVGHRFM